MLSASFKNLPPAAEASAHRTESDWDHVVPVHTSSPHNTLDGQLPNLSSIERQEELFPMIVPYWLHVRSIGPTFIIQGSHSKSLELITEYFTNWTKNIGNSSSGRVCL